MTPSAVVEKVRGKNVRWTEADRIAVAKECIRMLSKRLGLKPTIITSYDIKKYPGFFPEIVAPSISTVFKDTPEQRREISNHAAVLWLIDTMIEVRKEVEAEPPKVVVPRQEQDKSAVELLTDLLNQNEARHTQYVVESELKRAALLQQIEKLEQRVAFMQTGMRSVSSAERQQHIALYEVQNEMPDRVATLSAHQEVRQNLLPQAAGEEGKTQITIIGLMPAQRAHIETSLSEWFDLRFFDHNVNGVNLHAWVLESYRVFVMYEHVGTDFTASVKERLKHKFVPVSGSVSRLSDALRRLSVDLGLATKEIKSA